MTHFPSGHRVNARRLELYAADAAVRDYLDTPAAVLRRQRKPRIEKGVKQAGR